MKDKKITIHFLAPPFWHRTSVETTPAELPQTLLEFGKLGYVPEAVPPGGWRFPYDNHDDFPWEMIGATKKTFTGDNGQQRVVVFYKGEAYTQRVLHANPNKNLPAAIKYSRGARPGDPPDIIEADGDFKYVTLIIFKGAGKTPMPKPSGTQAAQHAEPRKGKPTLTERYEAAKARIASIANKLSSDAKAKLLEEMRKKGLTTPPEPLTEDFVASYEAFTKEAENRG